MMDIVIVDDEALARQRLSKMLSEMGYEVIAEAANGQEALAAIEKYDPAILLLDIEMPGENGLVLAEKLSEFDTPPAIIFTTAYDQYALKAFATLASGYVLKPIEKAALQKALETAQRVTKTQLNKLEKNTAQTNNKKREHIASKGHRGIELIALDSIRFFMADQKYVAVIYDKGEVLIDETLKELESEFSDVFIRVHRNSLVALNYIEGLERDQQGHYHVRLSGVEQRPLVSRRYASKVKSVLKKL